MHKYLVSTLKYIEDIQWRHEETKFIQFRVVKAMLKIDERIQFISSSHRVILFLHKDKLSVRTNNRDKREMIIIHILTS